MSLNNQVIRKKKLPSFLITTNKNVFFYEKNGWKVCHIKYLFKNHKIKRNTILMSFNYKKGKIRKNKNLNLIFKT